MRDEVLETSLINDPIRVMIVDDSAIIRGFISKMITEDERLLLTASASGVDHALGLLDTKDVEVIILDIEMNGKSGIDALPLFLKKKSNLKIIMASTLTVRNAEISMKALSLGASDYIPKPSSTGIIGNNDFKTSLISKIKDWGLAARRGHSLKETSSSSTISPVKNHNLLTKSAEIKLAPTNRNLVVDAIAIGSSTGGPQALAKVFEGFKDTNIEQPIFITQHIPPTFTKILAEHLSKLSGKRCFEGEDGMIVENGCVYIAPGGKHMIIEKTLTSALEIKIIDTPAENFCKPSVEPMVRSLVKIFKGKLLEVILTGMGNDGHISAKDVVNEGGNVIAQDQETSVVWGMPGAVAAAGLCSSILPISEISAYIKKVAARR